MAASKPRDMTDKKRKSRKRKARTEVSSSSESESEIGTKSPTPAPEPMSQEATQDSFSKPSKKEKKKKVVAKPISSPDSDEGVRMQDTPSVLPTTVSQSIINEEFNAIYLRKVAAEVADDLDKVREAQDFKASSVPMLVHALKQGESLFSVDEKRRVVEAARA